MQVHQTLWAPYPVFVSKTPDLFRFYSPTWSTLKTASKLVETCRHLVHQRTVINRTTTLNWSFKHLLRKLLIEWNHFKINILHSTVCVFVCLTHVWWCLLPMTLISALAPSVHPFWIHDQTDINIDETTPRCIQDLHMPHSSTYSSGLQFLAMLRLSTNVVDTRLFWLKTFMFLRVSHESEYWSKRTLSLMYSTNNKWL